MKYAPLYPWYQLPIDLAFDSGSTDVMVDQLVMRLDRFQKNLPLKKLAGTVEKNLSLECQDTEQFEELEAKSLELRKLLNTGIASELMLDILAGKVPVWFMSGGRMQIPTEPRILLGALCPFITEEVGIKWLRDKSYNLIWKPRLLGLSEQEIKDKHLFDSCIEMGMEISADPYRPLKGVVKFANRMKLPRKTLTDALNRHRSKGDTIFK